MTNPVGSRRARSAAIRLLRWYPRPWRRRYLVEMQALLEQMPVRWWQVANLVAMGVREWLSPRALGWPARGAAGRVQTARFLTYLAAAFALDGVARVVAWKIRAAGVVVSDPVSTAATVVFLVLTVRIFFTSGRYRWHQKKFPKAPERDRPGLLGGWEIALWTCLMFPWLVLRHVEPTPTYLSPLNRTLAPYMHLYLVGLVTHSMLRASLRSKRLKRVQSAWALRRSR